MVTLYPNSYRVAVVGATGNAGSETLNMLAELDFPISKLYVVASNASVGKYVDFGNRGKISLTSIDNLDFSDIDIAFFCAGSSVSKKYVELAVSKGTTVIDKTSLFRYRPEVPLIIPEVNASVLEKGAPIGIVSNPNCVVIPLSMTLKAIDNISKIKRVIVSTYQAVSGAGKKGNNELFSQTKKIIESNNPLLKVKEEFFKKQIAFNVIPMIDEPRPGGITGEEEKISNEILKIIGKYAKTFVTAVRVPVFRGHSMSVVVETNDEILPSVAYDSIQSFNGISVIDGIENYNFATPKDAENQNIVFVSRIRRDTTTNNSLGYWVTCDNLRKGAALNGVMIAKTMIKIDPTLGIFKLKNK